MCNFDDSLCVFSGMTSISALIKAAEITPGSARNIRKIYYDRDRAEANSRKISFLRHKSDELAFELIGVDCAQLDALVKDHGHGGFVAECGERPLRAITVDDVIPDGVYFVLEGIEDPFNFGYTLRSLYAAGATAAILPPRNWMSAAGQVSRSSAGCSELLSLFSGDLGDAIKTLKSCGYRIACANIRDSVSLFEADLRAPIAFVIGGEKRGISASLLKLADINVRIPYGRDFMGSLPSASSAAIIAYEAARKNNKIDQ